MPVVRSALLTRPAVVVVASSAMAMTFGLATSFAHEGHAPLPTKGVTVSGNTVLLSDKARKAIGLTTSEIVLGDLRHTVEVNARVELPWSQQAMITSLVSGKIEKVLARPGETVKAGQELAHVASVEMESLQLAMLKAASELRLARKLVEQRRSLDAEGVIAGRSLLEAENSLTRKLAELRIAEEKLRTLGIDDKTLETIRAGSEPLRIVAIKSPLDGVITHADVRVGQLVTPTDHLYHVVDTSRVWIVGEVLESDVRHLEKDQPEEKGQPVKATFVAHVDKTFRGVIDHVRLKMDRRRRTQSVVIAVDNHERLLRPGMFGRVSIAEIAVENANRAIVCAADAILKSRSGRYVLVECEPGEYESRKVKLGLAKGKHVEVLDGLFPRDKVVVVGAYLLASLLGNEHKARTNAKKTSRDTGETQPRFITVADATVELPTDRQAFAGPRIQGRIRSVHAEPSQRVERGQVLARVESLELRTVQLDLLQTLSRLRLTQQSLARLEPLEDRGATPRRQVWELQNQRETLLHQIASLERRLAFFGLTKEEIARLEEIDLADEDAKPKLLSTVPITAPAAGWIVGFHVVPGQVVHPQGQLFEIHELSKVWVKGYVFERDVAQVAVGQPARVTFAAFPDLKAVGKVVRIAPTMEESERVLPVWVEVDNSERLLKEGMLARVAVLAHAPIANGKTNTMAELRPTRPRR